MQNLLFKHPKKKKVEAFQFTKENQNSNPNPNLIGRRGRQAVHKSLAIVGIFRGQFGNTEHNIHAQISQGRNVRILIFDSGAPQFPILLYNAVSRAGFGRRVLNSHPSAAEYDGARGWRENWVSQPRVSGEDWVWKGSMVRKDWGFERHSEEGRQDETRNLKA